MQTLEFDPSAFGPELETGARQKPASLTNLLLDPSGVELVLRTAAVFIPFVLAAVAVAAGKGIDRVSRVFRGR